jgi:hypothetical protein
LPPSTPGSLAHAAAAFDSRRHRIVYAGGSANDVWALDTDRLTFTKLAPVGAPPTPADRQWALYDAEHDRLIVAAVDVYALTFAGDANGAWQRLDFTVDNQGVGGSAVAALDPTRRAIFALDPVAGPAIYPLLTNVARAVAVAGALPSSLAGARLEWDDTAKRLLLFAGSDVYGLDADADGSNVQAVHIATMGASPPPRDDAVFAISGAFALVFGGATPAGCALDDTWYLVGENQWSVAAPATTCL